MRYVDFNQERIFVKFTDPSSDLVLHSDFIFREAEEKARINGLLSQEEAMDLLRSEGKWTSDMERQEVQLTQAIKNLKSSINKLKYQKIQQRKAKIALEESEKSLGEIYKVKNQLETSTIEYFAEIARRRWLMRRCVETDKKLDSNLASNERFLERCIWTYYSESVPKVSQVRELSRTEPWRMYWTLSKETGTSLFNNVSTDMTDSQYMLVLWSRIYDFAFESDNRPDEDVLDDDTKFDAWYEREIERIEEDRKGNARQGNWQDAQEVFIPADSEGAKDVYSMNSKQNRDKIKTRFDAIDKQGSLTEANLPDVKKDLIMQANRTNSQAIVNRSKGGL